MSEALTTSRTEAAFLEGRRHELRFAATVEKLAGWRCPSWQARYVDVLRQVDSAAGAIVTDGSEHQAYLFGRLSIVANIIDEGAAQ